MGKFWVEICLISARGLRRTSVLWKLQWFAVGWIDPNNKYCTKIDASKNANPVWKTKFSILVDSSEPNFKDLALHIEVYSREPVFLTERLYGTATVVLKEFLNKFSKTEVSKPVDELGSFQLWKRNSSKPQGFVDISIRISEEKEEPSSYPGDEEGFIKLNDYKNDTPLTNQYGPAQAYPPRLPLAPFQLAENLSQQNHPYTPYPSQYSSSSVGGPSYASAAGPSNHPPPPPPPPPANVGYLPSFLPRTTNGTPSYINMPSSGVATGRKGGPGFGMGLGAGALAAGAVIFGDDFLSGFDSSGGLPDVSVNMSTAPPF